MPSQDSKEGQLSLKLPVHDQEQIRSHVVSKSVALIGARCDLSINEQKTLLLIISSLGPHGLSSGGEGNRTLAYRLTDMSKALGLRACDYRKTIERVLENLQYEPLYFTPRYDIEVAAGNDMAERYRHQDAPVRHTGWLEWSEYDPARDLAVLKISENVLPYIQSISTATVSYYLGCILHMPRTHSIILFELMYSFREQGYCDIMVDKLREAMSATNSYKGFGLFRTKLIDPNLPLLRKYAGLDVSYTEAAKVGNKITKLRFTIKKLDNYKPVPYKQLTTVNEEFKANPEAFGPPSSGRPVKKKEPPQDKPNMTLWNEIESASGSSVATIPAAEPAQVATKKPVKPRNKPKTPRETRAAVTAAIMDVQDTSW